MLLSSTLKGVFSYSCITNRSMNYSFSVKCINTVLGLACQVGLSKAIPLLFHQLRFACFINFDFAFPNVIFSVNINSAPFLGSLSVEFFITRLWGVLRSCFTAWQHGHLDKRFSEM